ncbi:MAG TPA: N-acetyl sugar amidotransferase [Candidatus Margulisbacteria bacterium]|nr:MAG: ATPase [Candidatus Margulisbacteria bacterium GWD2_39_127]HAR62793.1 N-acetyl sugar amidotransferase [Candidatus Margulisiibacteriota bacterium]
MKVCTKCVLPETHDTIMFDESGVCGICRQAEYRDEKVDWQVRKLELDGLIAQYKDTGLYDCIVPFSGGKDSVFQLWYVINELKLKPLVVRFNHWGYRPQIHQSNTMILKKLGADVFEFTMNWHVIRELMLESLIRRGDFCWHCHTGIYAGVINMAVKFEVPLILWGESIAEYASWYSYEEKEEVDEKRFNRVMNLGITADDMSLFLNGRVSMRDLWMLKYPAYSEIRRLKLRSICLGNYFKWDTKKQVEIIKQELGWTGQDVEGIPPIYDYEKIECQFQGVRDYAKYIKRGYGRTAHLVGIDIRNGRMTREEGNKLAEEYDGKRPASLDHFLEILQITEEDFYNILTKHQVFPWEFDPSKVGSANPLHDMDQWDCTNINKPVGAKVNNKLETYL